MENLNHQLYTELNRQTEVTLISWGGSQRWLVFVLAAFFFKACWRLLRRPAIRAVYIGDSLLAPLGVLLKKIFRKPVIIIACGLDITWPFPPYQFLIPRCLKILDHVVSISPETRVQCLKRGLPPENVTFIPIGIPESIPENPAWSADLKTRLSARIGKDLAGRRILLTVGRLVKRKGVEDFIRTVLPRLIAARRDILYLVVGEGVQREGIEAAVAQTGLGEHVLLTGRVGTETLREIYAAADLFVMPNIRVANDMEGFGIVALEAAAAGLPVVAADIEGIQAAVQDGANGMLVPCGDALRYTEVILHFLADEEARRDFGARAKAFVREHYAWGKIAEQYLSLLDDKGAAA